MPNGREVDEAQRDTERLRRVNEWRAAHGLPPSTRGVRTDAQGADMHLCSLLVQAGTFESSAAYLSQLQPGKGPTS